MGETLEQLRDELAGLMGWTVAATADDGRRTCWINERYNGRHAMGRVATIIAWEGEEIHPVTLTLDWIADHGLPEGWFWWLVDFYETRVDVTINGSCDGDILTSTAPTELHARLAACVAAWKAQAERGGT